MSDLTQNIVPVYMEGLDCVDNTVLTVCQYIRGECESAFWDSWSIKYKPDFIIGNGLNRCPKQIQENVRKLYGIEFVPQGGFDRKNCKKMITEYMGRDGVLIAGLKTNAFPWNEAYNQDVNGVHFLIFKSISDEGIWCTDAMPKKENALLGWNDIRRGILSIIRVKVHEKQKKVDMDKVFRHVRKNVKPKSIRRLREKMERDFQAEREFGNQRNIWRIPLYNLFLAVKGGHEQFEAFLKQSEWNSDLFMIERMHALTVEWEALKVLTVKMHREYFSGKLDTGKVKKYKSVFSEKLHGIEMMEEETLAYFYRSYKKRAFREKNLIFSDKVDFEFHEASDQIWYINLNYNEHTHMVNSEDFIVGDIIQYERIWKTEYSDFKLPKLDGDSYNCMFCDGQKLIVEGNVRKICLLVYATYGAQFEQVEVSYEGKKEVIHISVSDWTEEPLHDEKIVWQTEFKSKTPENNDYIGKIVMIELHTDVNKVCKYIALPKCRDLHLFAVTAVK